MRQSPFPPAHAGGNPGGKTLPRFPTPTPRSQRKDAQPLWANRTLAPLGDVYVDRSPSVSPGNIGSYSRARVSGPGSTPESRNRRSEVVLHIDGNAVSQEVASCSTRLRKSIALYRRPSQKWRF